MIKAFTLAAAAAAALATGGAAQAHEYGAHGYSYDRQDLPPPPYAHDGRDYAPEGRAEHKGFPLVGADAGVTILGLHIGGSAKVRLGLDEELRGYHHRRHGMMRRYAAPAPAYRGYAEEGGPPCPQDERGRW